MSGDEFGRLIYLVLLGAVIGGYFFLSNRERMGEMARQASLWGLIFVGVIVSYGLWNDISGDIVPRQAVFEDGGRIEAPRRDDGHYYLTLNIDGVDVEFVVDTGATSIVLSEQDALAIGINPDNLNFTGRASTANGEVRTARTTLENVRIGDVAEGDLRAWVNEGELETSLLGMDYLQRFDSVQITGSKLIMER